MTEESIVKALMKPVADTGASTHLPTLLLQHPKWGLRGDIQTALLECGKLRFADTTVLVHSLSTKVLRTTLDRDRLPAIVKAALLEELSARDNRED